MLHHMSEKQKKILKYKKYLNVLLIFIMLWQQFFVHEGVFDIFLKKVGLDIADQTYAAETYMCRYRTSYPVFGNQVLIVRQIYERDTNPSLA